MPRKVFSKKRFKADSKAEQKGGEYRLSLGNERRFKRKKRKKRERKEENTISSN